MKSRWIVHNDQRIFFVDFTDFGSDAAALRAEAKAIIETVTQEPLNSVRSLSDARGTVGSPETLSIMRSIVARTNRYVRRRAIVGMTGPRRTLIEIMNRITGAKQFAMFDDADAAKDWLLKD